jgi:hypothetical protein
VKKLIAPALLAVLALTGCSAAATPAASPAVSVAPATEEQKAALMRDLAKVNPQLEGPRVLAVATLSCRSVLQGEPEEVQIMSVKDRFSRASDKPLTDPDANRIIEIIKTNGFCVKA